MASSAMVTRPRLRTNVFFAPSPDGTGALCLHGERVIAMQGRSTYSWLIRLAPYLDGRFTVDAPIRNKLDIHSSRSDAK